MTGIELVSLALCLHNIVGKMPVVLKCKESKCILIEEGDIIDIEYDCKPLDIVFDERVSGVSRVSIDNGRYAGIPIYVSTVFDPEGNVYAAIGIIDTAGLFKLKEYMDLSSKLNYQLNSI
jgi:hypothetical protein